MDEGGLAEHNLHQSIHSSPPSPRETNTEEFLELKERKDENEFNAVNGQQYYANTCYSIQAVKTGQDPVHFSSVVVSVGEEAPGKTVRYGFRAENSRNVTQKTCYVHLGQRRRATTTTTTTTGPPLKAVSVVIVVVTGRRRFRDDHNICFKDKPARLKVMPAQQQSQGHTIAHRLA